MKKVSLFLLLTGLACQAFTQTQITKQALILRGHTDDVNSIAITAAGRMIATGSYDSKICLYTEEGGFLRTVSAHNASVEALCFSKDGKYLFSGSNDASARQIEASTGTILRGFNGHTGTVTAVAVDPATKVFFSGGEDGTIRFWNLEKGGEQMKLITVGNRINALAVTNDGKYLLVGCNSPDVQVYDMMGKLVSTYKGHKDYINSIAVSMNGRYAVSGSNDKTAILWDLKTGQKIRSFEGHLFKINSVFVSFDSRYLITGSNDGTAKIWEVEKGAEIYTINNQDNKVRGAVITFEKKYAVTASPQKAGVDQGARTWLLGLDSIDKKYIKVTNVAPIPQKETPQKPTTKPATGTTPTPAKDSKKPESNQAAPADVKKTEQPRVAGEVESVKKPEVTQVVDSAALKNIPKKGPKTKPGEVKPSEKPAKPTGVITPPAEKPAPAAEKVTTPEETPAPPPAEKVATPAEKKPAAKGKGGKAPVKETPQPPKEETKQDTTTVQPTENKPANDGWKNSKFKKLK